MKTVTDIYEDDRSKDGFTIAARLNSSIEIFRHRTLEEAARTLDNLVSQGYELVR